MAHCANLYHTMGAGIARQIAKRFPEAVVADRNTVKGDTKLGGYSVGILQDSRRIYNLYAQIGIGNNGTVLNRNLRYDALADSLWRVMEEIDLFVTDEKLTLAIPWGIGCGLAGGNFDIVSSILSSLDKEFDKVNIAVYKL